MDIDACELLARINALDTPAFVGKPEALDELIEIADSSYVEDESVSAAAYKSIADARRHRIGILEMEICSLKSKLKPKDAYKSYITAHADSIQEAPRTYAQAISYSEYSRRLELQIGEVDIWAEFYECADNERLKAEYTRVGKHDGEARVAGLIKMILYLWACDHFISVPDDEESVGALCEARLYADFSKLSGDVLLRAKLWPLVELAVP